jgi:hypothetical protein
VKIRSREINILSMSALDMFCAALGAFMFLALLSLPFAPNLGPKADEVAQLRKENQQLRTSIQQARSERDQALQALQKAIQQRATDIAIVIDTTGSMSTSIDGLKRDVGDLAQILNRLTDHARIAIISYKDSQGACAGGPGTETLPLTATDDAGFAQLQSFANRLTAGVFPGQPADCNRTPDEDVFAGMQEATRLAWTAEPRNRFIVVIGDNAAHPAEIEPALRLASEWGAGGAHMSTLQIDTVPDATVFYTGVARNGNGSALQSGRSFALSILLAMTEK